MIRLHHFVSYEYLRIIIWHGLNFEHFKKLENLKNLENQENLENEVVLFALGAFTSDLGLNVFESCFNLFKHKFCL